MKKSIAILLLITSFTSCNELVEGLNENPNGPISAPFQNILSGAEVGNIIFQTGEPARCAGIFCGYYTGIDRQHLGFSTYTITTSDFDALWADGYINALRNAKVAEEYAIEENLTGISLGITQALQALTFGTMASLWGDIPFEEAVNDAFANPVFEDQLLVYEKVQGLLDQAIENLDLNIERPTSGADIYFDGDPEAWIAMANTLKARYYLHTRQYGEAYAAAQQGILSEIHSMTAPHGDALDENNLSYQFFKLQSRSTDVITSDFMSSLVISSDSISPNIGHYRGHTKTNETGRANFYFQKNNIGIQPNTEDGFAAATASAPIVTYQENLLILAEAGLRSADFATGLNRLNDFRSYMNTGGYLTNADSTDILYEEFATTDFDAGGIENPDNIPADKALLREILEERYVTLFGQIEGFCDTRRTREEPLVRVPVVPNTGDQLPQRFVYPQTEIDGNTNTPELIPGLFDKTKINSEDS